MTQLYTLLAPRPLAGFMANPILLLSSDDDEAAVDDVKVPLVRGEVVPEIAQQLGTRACLCRTVRWLALPKLPSPHCALKRKSRPFARDGSFRNGRVMTILRLLLQCPMNELLRRLVCADCGGDGGGVVRAERDGARGGRSCAERRGSPGAGHTHRRRHVPKHGT